MGERLRQARGLSLASALFLGTLAFLLAATIATSCIVHLSLTTKNSDRNQAEALARMAAYEALARCAGNASYAGSLNLTTASAPGGLGLATFSAADAGNWGALLSFNQLTAVNNVTTAGGHPYPPKTVRIVGEGRYNGQRRRLELVACSCYPYALACNGTIALTGNSTIGGCNGFPASLSGWSGLPSGQRRTTRVASNSVLDTAITLNAPSQIVGDVESCGRIVGNSISGGVFENADSVPLPMGNVTGNIYSWPSITPLLPLVWNRTQLIQTALLLNVPNHSRSAAPGVALGILPVWIGDLTLHNSHLFAPWGIMVTGTVHLDNSLLTANGNISIAGGVDVQTSTPTGYGSAIVAGNNVKILSQQSYNPNARLAVLAGGDLDVQGSGSNGGVQGFFWCGDQMTVKNLTMMGCAVCAGPQTQLVNTNLLHNPEAANVTLSLSITSGMGQPFPTQPLALSFEPGSLLANADRLRVVRARFLNDGENP